MRDPREISKFVSQQAKALARRTAAMTVVGVIAPLPNGAKGLAWAVDKASAEEIEMLALALLDSVEREAAANAMSCDGCAHRAARARAAVSALREDEGPSRPRHAH